MRLENPRGFLRILKDFWGLLELFKDSYGQYKRSPRILEDSLRIFLKLVQDIQRLMAVLRHWGIFEVIHSSGIWRSPWRFQRSFLFFFLQLLFTKFETLNKNNLQLFGILWEFFFFPSAFLTFDTESFTALAQRANKEEEGGKKRCKKKLIVNSIANEFISYELSIQLKRSKSI